MVIGEPLNLFCCEFDLDGDWIVDQNSLMEVVQTLQQEWMLHSVKYVYCKNMFRLIIQNYSNGIYRKLWLH